MQGLMLTHHHKRSNEGSAAIQDIGKSMSWCGSLPNHAPNIAINIRSPRLDEAAVYSQIPKSAVAYWTNTVGKVLESGKQ